MYILPFGYNSCGGNCTYCKFNKQGWCSFRNVDASVMKVLTEQQIYKSMIKK